MNAKVSRFIHRFLFIAFMSLAVAGCSQTPPPGGNGNGDGNGDGNGNDEVPESAPLHDVIAYTPSSGDEIRLIEPDGTNDRLLWAHERPDPEDVYDIWSMSWNRAATRLAFASTHESWCSLFSSDIYRLGADGTGYGRVTQGPACDQLEDYPTGTVRVPVHNPTFDSFSGFLYFQGAPSVQPVNLPANGTGVVTFEDVADFGDGEDYYQAGAVIVAPNRLILAATIVDVQAGGTVTTSQANVYNPSTYWEVRSPSWRPDGSSIGFLSNFNSLEELPLNPPPLSFGESLLADDPTMPNFTSHLAWGPTDATSSLLLYAGTESFDSTSIYLVSEGSSGPGEQLMSYDSTEFILGLAWLPDASGFIYSVTEGDFFSEERGANLFLYEFSDEGDALYRLSEFVGEFAGRLSVSGDGTGLVFERADEQAEVGRELVEPELWLLDLTSGELELLVADGRAPAWSP